MSSTSLCDTERPSPVPSCLLAFLVLSCSNDLKSLLMSISLIPTPVSLTEYLIVASLSFISTISILSLTNPTSVNLMALLTIFIITCLTLEASPYRTDGILLSISNIKSISLLPILLKNIIPKSLRKFAVS